jgi:serine/alanine adding enzyme
MNVDVLEGPDEACERFVQQRGDAELGHMPAWTHMIRSAFGHAGYYLVARSAGQVCGVLPLVHVRSRLFGSRMVSQAFSDYGGPLATEGDAQQALYERAVDLARQHACECIEFRNVAAMPFDLHLRTDKVAMHLPLAADSQTVWKDLRPQIRNRIRQAEKEGVTVTHGQREMLDEFYSLWTLRMHELGTPCYSRELFAAILETFPERSRVFLAHCEGHVVAAIFAYAFNGCAHTRWGGALREYDSRSPNYLLNWAAIEYYCAAGMKSFDFGRSTAGSGQATFKERWGAQPVPLNWQYWTRNGREPRLATPEAPRYRRKIEMWKRLPLWVTRAVGPRISCSLP